MKEFLDGWVRDIAFYTILMTVLLHLLPGESQRKYVRFFLGVVLGAWAVGQFGIYSAYVGFLPLAAARTFIAVGTAPLESETPEETAVEAAEEMEEAEKLEKEQKL